MSRVNVADIDKELGKAKEIQKQRFESNGSKKAMSRFKAERGTTSAFIVLNKSFKDAEWVWEHKLSGKNPNGSFFEKYEPCLQEENDCPLCQLALDKDNSHGIKPAQFRFGVTVLPVKLSEKGVPSIDYYEYKDKEGNMVKRHARKFFVVPLSDQNTNLSKFRNVLEACEAETGDIRGCLVTVERASAKMSYSTGEPVDVKPGKRYLKLKESQLEKLLEKSGYEGIKNKDGEVIATKESLIEPVEDFYGEFIEKSEDELRSLYDVNYVSKEDTLDDEDDFFDEDDSDLLDDEPKAKSTRVESDSEEEDIFGDEEETEDEEDSLFDE